MQHQIQLLHHHYMSLQIDTCRVLVEAMAVHSFVDCDDILKKLEIQIFAILLHHVCRSIAIQTLPRYVP